MKRDFAIQFQQAQIDDLWNFADQIEQATGLMIWWTVTAYYRGHYFLSGEIL